MASAMACNKTCDDAYHVVECRFQCVLIEFQWPDERQKSVQEFSIRLISVLSGYKKALKIFA